jgi:hypothetical protein
MINNYERSDIVHIMKMNRFTLIDSDTAQLTFSRCFQEKDYAVGILMMENEPQVKVKQNESLIVRETFRSIDDLKIFFEERLYQYLGEEIG